MKRLPTDLQILNSIYDRYYNTFTAYSERDQNRRTKNFFPIDIGKIANDMGIDVDIIFGRLYYDMEKRYSYQRDNSAPVNFFIRGMGEDLHCVNFPCLASVLANLRDENRKHRFAISLSTVSLFVSVTALFVSVLKWYYP